MQTSWTWTTDTRTYPPKCSSEWNLDNVGPFEQTLWHTCCMFHTGLCPRFSTFKHWKNIWKLKPGARRRHKAIMSPLLFLMNLLQDDDLTRKKQKGNVWLLKWKWFRSGTIKKMHEIQLGSKLFLSASRGVRGRWDAWNTETTEQSKLHTHTHTYGGILNSDHTPRQV